MTLAQGAESVLPGEPAGAALSGARAAVRAVGAAGRSGSPTGARPWGRVPGSAATVSGPYAIVGGLPSAATGPGSRCPVRTGPRSTPTRSAAASRMSRRAGPCDCWTRWPRCRRRTPARSAPAPAAARARRWSGSRRTPSAGGPPPPGWSGTSAAERSARSPACWTSATAWPSVPRRARSRPSTSAHRQRPLRSAPTSAGRTLVAVDDHRVAWTDASGAVTVARLPFGAAHRPRVLGVVAPSAFSPDADVVQDLWLPLVDASKPLSGAFLSITAWNGERDHPRRVGTDRQRAGPDVGRPGPQPRPRWRTASTPGPLSVGRPTVTAPWPRSTARARSAGTVVVDRVAESAVAAAPATSALATAAPASR